MHPLHLQSEQFAPTGNLSSDGVKNQLGRPSMDRLTVLLREAVQNSWDARCGDKILFGVSGRLLHGERLDSLRNVVLAQEAPGTASQAILRAAESLPVLALYDRGTVGLAGPTRADAAVEPGAPTNFVDFLRNSGHAPDRAFGGGTYGFGKAAYYLASSLRTICVHTRYQDQADLASRFMAAALGPAFDRTAGDRRTRYTGRHWWGALGPDGIVDPLVGAEADLLAQSLGLPDLPGSGTTILILGAELDGGTIGSVVRRAADAVATYWWPKLIDGNNGEGSIEFRFEADGEELRLPSPAQDPHLSSYAAAFRSAVGGAGPMATPLVTTTSITWNRSRTPLGVISLVKTPTRPGLGPGEIPPPPRRHVALMRAPHMVVKYLEGPPLPYDLMDYSGVFLVDPRVDAAFAQAEPPTHDDWAPENIDNPEARTIIRVALREIKRALAEFTAVPGRAAAESQDLPLGAFADHLGGLIAAVPGSGAAIPLEGDSGRQRTPRNSGSARGLRIAVQGSGRLALVAGGPALLVDFDVEHGDGVIEGIVEAHYGVLVDGGAVESEPPAGAAVPKLIGWRAPDGTTFKGSERITIPAALRGRWSVAIAVPADAAVSLELRSVRPDLP